MPKLAVEIELIPMPTRRASTPQSLRVQGSKALRLGSSIGASIIRIGFWGPFFYDNWNKDGPKGLGVFLSLYISAQANSQRNSLGFKV